MEIGRMDGYYDRMGGYCDSMEGYYSRMIIRRMGVVCLVWKTVFHTPYGPIRISIRMNIRIRFWRTLHLMGIDYKPNTIT